MTVCALTMSAFIHLLAILLSLSLLKFMIHILSVIELLKKLGKPPRSMYKVQCISQKKIKNLILVFDSLTHNSVCIW